MNGPGKESGFRDAHAKPLKISKGGLLLVKEVFLGKKSIRTSLSCSHLSAFGETAFASVVESRHP